MHLKSTRSSKVLALAGAFLFPFFAHATSITYNLIGVTTSAGSVTGTVTINSATDLVTAANITFNDSAVGNPIFMNIGSPNTYNGLGQDYISGPSDSSLNYGGQIALYYNTANIGTGDLLICLASGPCGTQSNQASFVQVYTSGGSPTFNLTAGELDPIGNSTSSTSSAVTPEPSSLIFLGTGLFAIAISMAFMHARSSKSQIPQIE